MEIITEKTTEETVLQKGYDFARKTELSIALDEVCKEYIRYNIIMEEKGKWQKGN